MPVDDGRGRAQTGAVRVADEPLPLGGGDVRPAGQRRPDPVVEDPRGRAGHAAETRVAEALEEPPGERTPRGGRRRGPLPGGSRGRACGARRTGAPRGGPCSRPPPSAGCSGTLHAHLGRARGPRLRGERLDGRRVEPAAFTARIPLRAVEVAVGDEREGVADALRAGIVGGRGELVEGVALRVQQRRPVGVRQQVGRSAAARAIEPARRRGAPAAPVRAAGGGAPA